MPARPAPRGERRGDDLSYPPPLGEVDEDELYEAMDWLLERQGRIKRRLAIRCTQAESTVTV